MKDEREEKQEEKFPVNGRAEGGQADIEPSAGGKDGAGPAGPESPGREEGDSADEAGSGAGHSYRMVEIDRQPGAMNCPFATHGPAPGDENAVPENRFKAAVKKTLMDGEEVSYAFVIGVLIVVSILFIGLLFASQRRRLRELSDRVGNIERILEIRGD